MQDFTQDEQTDMTVAYAIDPARTKRKYAGVWYKPWTWLKWVDVVDADSCQLMQFAKFPTNSPDHVDAIAYAMQSFGSPTGRTKLVPDMPWPIEPPPPTDLSYADWKAKFQSEFSVHKPMLMTIDYNEAEARAAAYYAKQAETMPQPDNLQFNSTGTRCWCKDSTGRYFSWKLSTPYDWSTARRII